MWMTVGIGAAIACLLLAALGFGVVLVAERAQANAANAPVPAEDLYYYADADLPLTADEVELEEMAADETSYDEPVAEEPLAEEPIPVAARADYGWPVG
jgi:NAD(P)-dependent dehydrogenase (short-subunit alcohol dehydrogenase family)